MIFIKTLYRTAQRVMTGLFYFIIYFYYYYYYLFLLFLLLLLLLLLINHVTALCDLRKVQSSALST